MMQGILCSSMAPLMSAILTEKRPPKPQHTSWSSSSTRLALVIWLLRRRPAGPAWGLAWLVKGERIPGGGLGPLPLRNVLRTPRRTVMTLVGIGAVVTIVVALAGVMDSFDDTRQPRCAGRCFAAVTDVGADDIERVGELRPRLRLAAGRLTAAEIARDLHVSVNTVKAHLRSIYRKLDVSRRREAVVRGRELGAF